MKVVHVYGGTLDSSRVKRMGGIEEHFISLSSKLKENVYFVYAGKPYNNYFIEEVEKNASKCLILGDKSYLLYLFEFIKIVKALKRSNDNIIVHVHFGPISQMIILVCRLMGIEHIYWTKHSRMAINKYSSSWFKSKLTSALVKKLICVSEAVETELVELNLGQGKTYILPLGLNLTKYTYDISTKSITLLRRELNIDENTFVITIVAQQRPEKRVEVFIKAFAEFMKNKKEANVVGLVVGGGPLEEENKKLASSLNILDKIKFLGLRHDIEVIYAISNTAGLTSETEGFGLAIAEAAGMSLPLFGSKAGAMPELIKDGKTGFLFDIGDYKELSVIFNKYYCDEKLCLKFGKEALKDMKERYDIGLCSDRLIQLYKNEFRS